MDLIFYTPKNCKTTNSGIPTCRISTKSGKLVLSKAAIERTGFSKDTKVSIVYSVKEKQLYLLASNEGFILKQKEASLIINNKILASRCRDHYEINVESFSCVVGLETEVEGNKVFALIKK